MTESGTRPFSPIREGEFVAGLGSSGTRLDGELVTIKTEKPRSPSVDTAPRLAPSSSALPELGELPSLTLLSRLEGLASNSSPFADGMRTPLSDFVVAQMDADGNEFIELLSVLVLSESLPSDIVAECLRWLSDSSDADSALRRRWLAERCLLSDDPVIRDGAILAIIDFRNHQSLSKLEKALAREEVPSLRQDIEFAIHHLTGQ